MPTLAFPKRAANDQGNDTPFEQAFSNLAHAYLDDRAPGLQEYEVGFQLVERDDDEFHPKAMGILGFKVGSQWLYAPCFFINGALKGHELLYIKNQDAFVPLKENWINYLLAKKPASLGEGVDRNTRELGVHYPDMFRALQSPHKYAASTRVRWADGERAALAAEAAALRPKLAAAGLDRPLKDWAVAGQAAILRHFGVAETAPSRLLDLLESGGVKAAAALHRTLAAYPTLRAGFDATYPAGRVKAAMDAIRARPDGRPRRAVKRAATIAGDLLDRRDAATRAKVEVHRFAGFAAPTSVLLDADDRAALVRSGLLIKDARGDDEVSRAYAVDVRIEGAKKFTNPADSGVYDVLAKDGSLEKCLVLVGPIGPRGREPWATVIRLEGARKAWLNIHPSFVFVAKQYKGWPDWYGGLPDAADLSKGGGPYVVLGPDGQATLPFDVVRDLGQDAGGGEAYEVRLDDHCEKPRAGGSTGTALASYDYRDNDGYSAFRDGARVHLGRKAGTKFRSNRGDVHVPAGSKLLKLRDNAGYDAGGGDDAGCCGLPGRSATPPIVPGSIIDVEAALLGKTAALALWTTDGGGSYAIAAGAAGVTPVKLAAADALVHLVAGRGFREKAARALLDAACDVARKGGGAFRCRAKYADAYTGGQPGGRGAPYLTSGGPYAPSLIDPQQGHDDVMGSAVAAQHPLEESIRVDDLKADPRNRDAYDPANPDPMATQVAQDAADKGQKDVFDTAMVANLLKMTRDDEMIDEHIPDLMKGLDRCGRLLFAYFWHGDQFSERFGDSDMSELEDSLRNTFENLGDLVLFLKQKSVDANPEESAADIDLGHIADQ